MRLTYTDLIYINVVIHLYCLNKKQLHKIFEPHCIFVYPLTWKILTFLSHRHDATNFCPGSGGLEVAAVICVELQADLTVDQYALMSSVYLEDKPIYFLQVSILIFCFYSFWQIS